MILVQSTMGSHLNFGDPWSQVWGPLQPPSFNCRASGYSGCSPHTCFGSGRKKSHGLKTHYLKSN